MCMQKCSRNLGMQGEGKIMKTVMEEIRNASKAVIGASVSSRNLREGVKKCLMSFYDFVEVFIRFFVKESSLDHWLMFGCTGTSFRCSKDDVPLEGAGVEGRQRWNRVESIGDVINILNNSNNNNDNNNKDNDNNNNNNSSTGTGICITATSATSSSHDAWNHTWEVFILPHLTPWNSSTGEVGTVAQQLQEAFEDHPGWQKKRSIFDMRFSGFSKVDPIISSWKSWYHPPILSWHWSLSRVLRKRMPSTKVIWTKRRRSWWWWRKCRELRIVSNGCCLLFFPSWCNHGVPYLHPLKNFPTGSEWLQTSCVNMFGSQILCQSCCTTPTLSGFGVKNLPALSGAAK